MRKILIAVGLWLSAAASADVDVVEADGMTAVIQRQDLNLDAPFSTEMVTITVEPGGPQAEEFASDIACPDSVVMDVDRARPQGGSMTFMILCAAYN